MKTQAISKTPEYRAWADIKQRCNKPRYTEQQVRQLLAAKGKND